MQLNIDSLRALGRHVGVYNPTKNKKKSELIKLIVAVLVGESEPVDRAKRGAPVKAVLNPDILHRLNEISKKNSVKVALDGDVLPNVNFDEKKADGTLSKYFGRATRNTLTVKSSNEGLELAAPPVYCGQVEKFSDYYCLFPSNGRDFKERILISEATKRNNSLKEGDLISCTLRKEGNFFFVHNVLRVNEGERSIEREDFESKELCLSKEKLPLNDKIFQYFLPLTKGGRTCFIGSPKSGKTTLLKNIVKDLTTENCVKTFALLVEQPIENTLLFKGLLDERNLVYTTYEDDAEDHVFSAEFILRRAKRYAEQGKDVVLIVDDLQLLAKAYDEVNYSSEKVLSCGLSAKTVRFIKRFLASARSFKNGGSLSILCALTDKTGNPEDDLFISELVGVFNQKILLREKKTVNDLFPTIDIAASFIASSQTDSLEYKNEEYLFILEDFIPRFGVEETYRLLQESESFEKFYERAKIKFFGS